MNKLTLPVQDGKKYVNRYGNVGVAGPHPTSDEWARITHTCGTIDVFRMTGRVTGLASQYDLVRDHESVADHIPAKGHVHASLMAEYAADAAECAEPWTRWERTLAMDSAAIHDLGWCALTTHPGWDEDLQYRRRPKTIMIGSRECVAPLRVAPNGGVEWFHVSLEGVAKYAWTGNKFCCTCLSAGCVFATKENAEAARLAILELLKP